MMWAFSNKQKPQTVFSGSPCHHVTLNQSFHLLNQSVSSETSSLLPRCVHRLLQRAVFRATLSHSPLVFKSNPDALNTFSTEFFSRGWEFARLSVWHRWPFIHYWLRDGHWCWSLGFTLGWPGLQQSQWTEWKNMQVKHRELPHVVKGQILAS